MSITSVASSTAYPSPAAASQAIASSVSSKPAASPAVTNSISSGASPGTTSADVQSRINGINALIQNAENFNWAQVTPV
jgi:hypothetical protein